MHGRCVAATLIQSVVCVLQSKFLEKNNDALHGSLEGLIHESRNAFLQALFAASQTATNGSVDGHRGRRGRC